jgi:hypothetical protein
MPILSTIIVICMATFGLAWIIADSKISIPFRTWIARHTGEDSIVLMLLECPPCLSFWIGLFFGIGYGLGLYSILIAFVTTCFSVIAWAIVGSDV